MAVGFTALLNFLLLATLVYRQWLPSQVQLIGLALLATIWLLARWQSRAERRASLAVAEDAETGIGTADQLPEVRDKLFRDAQGHYLRNDWVATEQLLLKLLKQDARDVESRLMLATLWRHQGRSAEALRQLDRLERLEAAVDWQGEIAAERIAIEEFAEAEAETDKTNDASPKRDEVLEDNSEGRMAA